MKFSDETALEKLIHETVNLSSLYPLFLLSSLTTTRKLLTIVNIAQEKSAKISIVKR